MKNEPVSTETVRLLIDTENISCLKNGREETRRFGASCRWLTSNTSESIMTPSDFDLCARNGGTGDDGGRSSGGNYSHSSSSGSTSPNFLKWSEHLDALLNDPIGLDLFQEYLRHEDQQRYHMLKFWLACRGLHRQPKDRITDCIKVIHSKLFLKIGHGISQHVSKSVAQQILTASKNKTPVSASVFDEASRIVYDVMKTVMYRNFLSSETYLNYAQKMQVEFCSADNDREATTLSEDELPRNCSPPLAMVEEDKELNFNALSIGKPESLRRLLHQHSTSCNRMTLNSSHRLHYNSYNPVSRQGSELHSLSSGRTDSQSDLSHFTEDMNYISDTGRDYVAQRHRLRQKRHSKKTEYELERSKIIINDIVNLPKMEPVKPRTLNADIPNKIKPREPNEFFDELASKLKVVKKEMENRGLVRSKLQSIDRCEDGLKITSHHSFSDSTLNRIDDDDQDILDEHVKRVWKDKTPGWSPSIGTPIIPKSPPTRRASSAYSCSSEKQYYPSSRCSSRSSHVYPGYGSMGRRKDKGANSLFSVDSGNGTDPAEYSDFSFRNFHKKNSTQTTSRSEYSQSSCYLPSYTTKSWTGSQRTITDSGVSVISNSLTNNVAAADSCKDKDRLVSSWQQEKKLFPSAKCSKSVLSAHMNVFDSKDECSTLSRKKTKSMMGSSKLRAGTVINSKDLSLPGQPFLADPNMPPLPFHRIDPRDTLEETNRRLQEISRAQKTPQIATKCEADCQISVVYNFSDDNFPYLLKIPGNKITLRMFKDHMPSKKGNFRYFFVTACEDLENEPVYEEINDDDRILPIWKGKVMSQIKDI